VCRGRRLHDSFTNLQPPKQRTGTGRRICSSGVEPGQQRSLQRHSAPAQLLDARAGIQVRVNASPLNILTLLCWTEHAHKLTNDPTFFPLIAAELLEAVICHLDILVAIHLDYVAATLRCEHSTTQHSTSKPQPIETSAQRSTSQPQHSTYNSTSQPQHITIIGSPGRTPYNSLPQKNRPNVNTNDLQDAAHINSARGYP
jgi:hypothetical protein